MAERLVGCSTAIRCQCSVGPASVFGETGRGILVCSRLPTRPVRLRLELVSDLAGLRDALPILSISSETLRDLAGAELRFGPALTLKVALIVRRLLFPYLFLLSWELLI